MVLIAAAVVHVWRVAEPLGPGWCDELAGAFVSRTAVVLPLIDPFRAGYAPLGHSPRQKHPSRRIPPES